MNEEFNPSPDFVARVMMRVNEFEAGRLSFERFIWSRGMRYLLAGGGTIFGILKAAPVF